MQKNGFSIVLVIIGVGTIILVVSTLIFLRFLSSRNSTSPTSSSPINSITSLLNTPSTPSASVSDSTNLEKRVSSLELSLSSLVSRINQLEKGSTTPATAPNPSSLSPTPTNAPTTNKFPLYIPMGTGTSVITTDWSTTSYPQVSIDPADYPGYTSMQMEVSLKLDQSNGQAFARLYDSDDGIAMLSSQVSTSASDYTQLSSNGFTIPAGKKTYKLQLKTLTGYAASVQFARIRVNF